jgi:hypothetical protein
MSKISLKIGALQLQSFHVQSVSAGYDPPTDSTEPILSCTSCDPDDVTVPVLEPGTTG